VASAMASPSGRAWYSARREESSHRERWEIRGRTAGEMLF